LTVTRYHPPLRDTLCQKDRLFPAITAATFANKKKVDCDFQRWKGDHRVQLLPLMPEADSKLKRLLAQGTDGAFHLPGNFDHRCLRL